MQHNEYKKIKSERNSMGQKSGIQPDNEGLKGGFERGVTLVIFIPD